MQARGLLMPVVGPSGAGKDTLLAAVRAGLGSDSRFVFARRVITRPAEAGGENHQEADEETFAKVEAQGGFALSWRAHGLAYGIPRAIEDELRQGRVVLANLSRAVLLEAAARYPVRVLLVTAPPALLAARLAARGRETAEDIAGRLAREVMLPPGLSVDTVMNDATPEEGAARLRAVLEAASFFAAAVQPGAA